MPWLYLLLAGLFEIAFTTCLKLSDGFTRPGPTVLLVLSSLLSFWMLSRALAGVELGTAYAVWCGIGAFGTAIVGILCFGDPVTAGRVVFLCLLIGSIIGLQMVSPGK